jgi:hypothetical protein
VSWWDRLHGRLNALRFRAALPVAAAAALLVAAVLLERPKPAGLPQPTTANMEALQPEQVVHALDEMEILSQFNDRMKQNGSTPDM